jgi:uncharacterized membrane protein
MGNPAHDQKNTLSMDAQVRLAYWDYIGRLPRALLRDEWKRVIDEAGGANMWLFPAIASAEANPGARMCPDVLYSILGYDVSEEPLRLSVPLSREPLWSLALVGDNAEGYFGVDDQLVEEDLLELVILGPGQSFRSQEDVRVVASPSDFGIAVVRTVVPGPETLEELDRLRKGAKSAPVPQLRVT